MPRLSAGVKTDGNVLPLEQPNRLRFTPEHVARAKARAHAETFFRKQPGAPAAEASSPFALPQRPPPGVVPKGDRIAQDQAGDFGGIVSWADTGFGYGNHSAFAEGQAFLGYPYLSILQQRAEYRVFSEIPAEEMTRKWVKFESTNDEKTEEKKDRIKDLTTFLEDLGTRDHFRRVAEIDGFFGRGHIYIDTGDGDDAEEMKMPIGNGRNKLSRSKIGKKRPILALKPIEPIWTYPTRYNSSDPTSPEWYNPSEWYVMGKQFHASRLPAFVGREVPDLLKPAYAFGGLSLSQMAVPYVDNWLRTRQSVSDIVHSFVVWVLSTNMQQLMQGQGDDLFARADFFNAIRDNRGLMLLDKDTEEFQNISAPLGSLDKLQAQAQEQLCSVGRMPAVKFTGIEPTGLNASSEGSIRVWGETIHGLQEKLFRRNLQTIVWFAMLSLWDEIDPDIKFSFVPLAELTELEQAELRQKNAETAAKYIDSGVLSQEEERERIAKDPASPWSNIDPSDVPELLEEEEAGLIPEGGGRAVAQVLGGGPGGGATPNGTQKAPKGNQRPSGGDRGGAQDAFPFRTRDGRLIEGKRGPAKAAALAVQSPAGILFVKRSDTANDHPGEWAFPAGGIKRGENLEDAARRETREETGLDYAGKTTEVCTVNAENGQSCTVFHGQVADPFHPQLDHEHSDFVWAPIDDPPLPLHPGAASALAVMSNGDQFCV